MGINNVKERLLMSTINNWKIFESKAVNYLQVNYGQYASFNQQGGEDSTIPDILVNTKKEQFYIETKSAKAQSGQFVLFPDYEANQFYFSEKNKTEENELTQIIVEYMNQNWDKYKNVSTEGLNIGMSDSIFASWITNYYKSKKVKYFISGSENDFVIIPIDDFSKSFDVTANYRIKRSGTRALPKKYFSDISEYFKKLYQSSIVIKKGKHTYVNTGISNENLDKTFFIIENIEDTTFYLSKDDIYDDGYRISVRSNTNNPNIIFSINLKNNISGINHTTFISKLSE